MAENSEPGDTRCRTESSTLLTNDSCNIILDSITEGVFTVDDNWKITSFNRAAEMITGVSRVKAVGQSCREILKADICEYECALRQTLRTGTPILDKPVHIIDAAGNRKPISISTALLKDNNGKIMGAVETFRDLTMIENLRKQIHHDYNFEDIISRNSTMQQLFDIMPEIADTSSTVYIQGESGTGKELVARALHNTSPRKENPFIAVNCGALPENLLESELFGYRAGAFTDARKDKKGRIALAEKGTLFLDEIGDISPAMQVKLLRFLEERTYEPLGAEESLQSDVRIITATNKNIEDLVKDGSFRQDLYYRINVVRIEIPPLRDRMEDIPLLVEHFISSLNRIQGKDVPGISDDAMAALMSYDYPGNVRELENIIERVFVLCRGKTIQPEHLPSPLNQTPPDSLQKDTPATTSMKQLEAGFLMNALSRNNWNRTQTARELGIHKSTLFRKIKSLGLQVPKKTS